MQIEKKFNFLDTPGHPKVRHHALSRLAKPASLAGIIYVVDSADLSPGSAGLTETGEYLYEILLVLQKSLAKSKNGKAKLLIAANKLDLFTALPPPIVKRVLEEEITRVRDSKARGLLDSGVKSEVDAGAEKDWLGEGGEGGFQFGQLEEVGVYVEVEGGNVVGEDEGKRNVGKWWDWIANNL